MDLKAFVLCTAIIELLAGAGLFIAPGLLPELSGASALSVTLARMYGAAAVAIGYYAFMVWHHYNSGSIQGFLKTFLVFHIGVTVAAYFGYSQGILIFIGVVVLHAILALLTLFYFIKTKSAGQ